MSLFGQDIKDNFCMLVTFADGKPPPVLAALKEAKLPCDDFFPFNNSGLFAENSGVQSFSQMFWDMGCKSFKRFFDNLTKMETKSLHQSKYVLQQRQLIEVTIDNLLPMLDVGLDKIEELRKEIKIIEQSQTEIDDNKDFTYVVFETQHSKIGLPEGRHVTNCLNCHVTCHKNCAYANDEDKKKCCVMAASGCCTQCAKKCFWTTHRNTPYIFQYETLKKQKTYTEKEKKYRTAENEKMTKKKVVKRMHEELCVIEEDIMKLVEKINECNNILKEIALRPDPLSVVEHIDLLIESEKSEKRPGFQSRIASLQNCRRRATIDKDIDRFKRSVTDTTKITTDEVNLPKESSDSEKTKGVLDFIPDLFSVPFLSDYESILY
jgi:Mg2+ and Co2+ transporter CorA